MEFTFSTKQIANGFSYELRGDFKAKKIRQNNVALVTIPRIVGSVNLVVAFEWPLGETLIDILHSVAIVHNCGSKGSAS